MKYYFNKSPAMPFVEAVSRVTEELKKKLDVDFKKYKILGACNPHFAYQALQKEDKIGTMLPCSVIRKLKRARSKWRP